jgi:hypothetical protein
VSAPDKGKKPPVRAVAPPPYGAAAWGRAALRAAVRDQPETPFAAILRRLVHRVPGARAAVLVDSEGETVDYAGRGEPYALRVAAAHWRIVLEHVRLSSPGTTWLAVAVGAVSFRIESLPDGYAVLLVVATGVGLPWGCDRAIAASGAELASEAGWGGNPPAPWYGLDVVTDARRRPTAVRTRAGTESIEIIGRLVVGPGRREQGWRVRTRRGIEANLVREAGSCWYVDELLVAAPSNTSPPKTV